jgi:plastocyanin
MAETTHTQDDLRERVILPIGVPLAAFVFIEIFVFALSRVLLTAGKIPAVGVALGVSLLVLLGCAAVAARPRMKGSTLLGLVVLLFVGTLAAGVWAAQRGPAPIEGHEEHGAGVAPAAEIKALNLVFDLTEIELPAGEEAAIHFVNQDSLEHNLSIYTSEAADEDLFLGELIHRGETTYEVGPLEAGTYYFRCDVHPTTMEGSVIVE